MIADAVKTPCSIVAASSAVRHKGAAGKCDVDAAKSIRYTCQSTRGNGQNVFACGSRCRGGKAGMTLTVSSSKQIMEIRQIRTEAATSKSGQLGWLKAPARNTTIAEGLTATIGLEP